MKDNDYMTHEEYLELEYTLVVRDLWNEWSIRKDNNGSSYVYDNFPQKEEFIKEYEVLANDVIDTDEDTMLPYKEEMNLRARHIEQISQEYDKVKKIREEFLALE